MATSKPDFLDVLFALVIRIRVESILDSCEDECDIDVMLEAPSLSEHLSTDGPGLRDRTPLISDAS